MTGINSIALLMVLSASLALSSGQNVQGGPHQIQGRAEENPGEVNVANVIGPNPLNPLNWTTCDATVVPKISCHDCNTRVICKPVGGLLKTCTDPARPHCNTGICSAVPSLACA